METKWSFTVDCDFNYAARTGRFQSIIMDQPVNNYQTQGITIPDHILRGDISGYRCMEDSTVLDWRANQAHTLHQPCYWSTWLVGYFKFSIILFWVLFTFKVKYGTFLLHNNYLRTDFDYIVTTSVLCIIRLFELWFLHLVFENVSKALLSPTYCWPTRTTKAQHCFRAQGMHFYPLKEKTEHNIVIGLN